MERYLLIDDIRTIDADFIARNSQQGKQELKTGKYTHLILDNDLGENIEGRHILTWAVNNDLVPDNVTLITSNPVARKAMVEILEYDMGYVFNNGWWSKIDQ